MVNLDIDNVVCCFESCFDIRKYVGVLVFSFRIFREIFFDFSFFVSNVIRFQLFCLTDEVFPVIRNLRVLGRIMKAYFYILVHVLFHDFQFLSADINDFRLLQ
ncbi:hypothetical protein D3C86_1479050 [compost metagenome]